METITNSKGDDVELYKISQALTEDLEYTYNKLSEPERKRLYKSTIVITGCAGFLGYYFCHFFYY